MFTIKELSAIEDAVSDSSDMPESIQVSILDKIEPVLTAEAARLSLEYDSNPHKDCTAQCPRSPAAANSAKQ